MHRTLRRLGILLMLVAGLSGLARGSPDRSLPWVTEAVQLPGLTFHTFNSRRVGAPVSYHVFTPAVPEGSRARLPVIYFLHGTAGGVQSIRPMVAHYGQAMQNGDIPPMHVVFVNGLPRHLWADSKDGSAPVESVFVNELIPEVDRTLPTIATRSGRILEGFSMGGYGAARIGFRHPDRFAGISSLAGGPFDLDLRGPRAERNPRLREALLHTVCGDDLAYFRAISPLTIARSEAANVRAQHVAVRLVVGTRDDTLDLNRGFHTLLEEIDLPHTYTEVPGVGHDAVGLLSELRKKGDTFYRSALRATP